MIFHTTHHAISIENHYITIPNERPIHESNCVTVRCIDDDIITTHHFYTPFYEWIAQCCTQSFSNAHFSVYIEDMCICTLSLQQPRPHQLVLYCADVRCYTIGRASAVVRDVNGKYDEAFSKALEQYVLAKKSLTVQPTREKNMKHFLRAETFASLAPYVEQVDIAYMPKEKAQHFIEQVVISCTILKKTLSTYTMIPRLQLCAGLKGANGFFDPSLEMIGLYYKYDRDSLMQLALFHEYGHLLDHRHCKNPSYKKKRQLLYEQLLKMPTLRAIQQDRSITEDHRQYLLCIEEVIARLFESYIYYTYYRKRSDKAFLFTIEEINMWPPQFSH